ncbi:MAG TPA: cell wall hydrolase [Sphingomicrobium sp.]|nr:cell wall hydrolase [Sphingomicrobium sp.]HET7575394.1 cell wall hydrolase [Sphingomicrobium sp.]
MAIHRRFTVKLLISLRSALLIGGALTAASVAPAQAGPSGSLASVANATLPKIAVPDLLDPQGQPQLSQPETDTDTGQASPIDEAIDQPDVDPSQDLPTLVAELRGPEAGSRELECLATGIYFESKGEPLAGQLAVGQVIANRAESGRFASTYCGVLFQRGQFSFIHGRSLPHVSHSKRQWQTAVAIAKIVDQDLKESKVGDALFFHARYVSPSWHLKRVASIGNHIFYR